MAEDRTKLSSEPLGPGPLGRVERAVAEMRRGVGLVVFDEDEKSFARLILSGETATQNRFAALLKAGTTPEILITPERAETLKIRLYSEGAIAVPLEENAATETKNNLGISARLDAIRAFIDPARDLETPLKGPFNAKREPMDDTGRASLQLTKLAGLLPAAISVRLKNHGPIAAQKFAVQNELVIVSSGDVLNYERDAAHHVTRVSEARVPLEAAREARLVIFREGLSGREHVAIIVGQPNMTEPVLVRLHSECFTGDLLDSLRCDCGPQLRGALKAMADAGAGVLLYLAQEGRAIGLPNKMRAYHLQDEGFDTFEANRRVGFEDDERLFDVAAEMLKNLGLQKIRLMTNNPAKLSSLAELGLNIVEHVPLRVEAGAHNAAYLDAKKKSGHLL